MSAFKVRPKGAAFEMYDEQTIPTGGSSTGVAFGPDGALYVTDWMNGPSERGRVWKIDSTVGKDNSARTRTSKILSEGMSGKDETYLMACLAEPDLRVRKAAQFELARKGKSGQKTLLAVARQTENQLARLHAIWGIGQVARGWPDGRGKDPDVVRPLLELLTDKDSEVRAQAAKVLGESAHEQAGAPLVGGVHKGVASVVKHRAADEEHPPAASDLDRPQIRLRLHRRLGGHLHPAIPRGGCSVGSAPPPAPR